MGTQAPLRRPHKRTDAATQHHAPLHRRILRAGQHGHRVTVYAIDKLLRAALPTSKQRCGCSCQLSAHVGVKGSTQPGPGSGHRVPLERLYSRQPAPQASTLSPDCVSWQTRAPCCAQ